MFNQKRTNGLVWLGAIGLIAAFVLSRSQELIPPTSGSTGAAQSQSGCGNIKGYEGYEISNPVAQPAGAIEVSIVFSPESCQYLLRAIEDFNRAYAEGRSPLTGQPLTTDESRIYVTGKTVSAGTVLRGIINALIAPDNQNVQRPTIWAPSVSHWLALANEHTGRELFDLADTQPIALAPVVMAIWESRIQAIRDTVGYDDVGWEELLGVLNSPNGWCDYGLPDCRRSVYYGHTDPSQSSTGLSTLMAEFYASARQQGFTGRRLELEQVNDDTVQQGVRDMEALIRHYSSRTTEFKQYIAQGPEYVDFVALEENDLIFVNRGLTDYDPPERLVALYPKEGTFWHEHPFGIVNADWTTQEQRDAARVFTQYMLTEEVQRIIVSEGFRPANPGVPLSFPFVEENGVTLEGPTTVLDVPDAEVILAVQQSWAYVKKQADIMLLIDVSGSMSNGGKLEQARQAALAFLDGMETGNRVGLAVFSDQVQVLVPVDGLEMNGDRLREAINSLQAGGGTALYAAIVEASGLMNQDTSGERIRAIVLLSDGQNTSFSMSLNDVIQTVHDSHDDLNPVIFIPVAYGDDADTTTLNSLARASATQIQAGDPENILRVLEIISSYF